MPSDEHWGETIGGAQPSGNQVWEGAWGVGGEGAWSVGNAARGHRTTGFPKVGRVVRGEGRTSQAGRPHSAKALPANGRSPLAGRPFACSAEEHCRPFAQLEITNASVHGVSVSVGPHAPHLSSSASVRLGVERFSFVASVMCAVTCDERGRACACVWLAAVARGQERRACVRIASHQDGMWHTHVLVPLRVWPRCRLTDTERR